MKLNKKQIYLLLSAAAVVVVLLVFTVLYVNMLNRTARIETEMFELLFEKDETIGKQEAQLSQLEGYVNQMRSVLGLPSISVFSKERESAEEEQSTGYSSEALEYEQLFYAAIPALVQHYHDKQAAVDFTDFISRLEAELKQVTSLANIQRSSFVTAELYLDNERIGEIVSQESDQYLIRFAEDKIEMQSLSEASSLDDVVHAFQHVFQQRQRKNSVIASLHKLDTVPEIQQELHKRYLRLDKTGKGAELSRRDDTVIFSISYDDSNNTVMMGDSSVKSDADFSVEFLAELKRHDTRTRDEILVDEYSRLLIKLLEDEAYNAALSEYSLTIRDVPREGSDYLYFEVFQDKTHIGSIGLQRWTGEIYLLDDDDLVIKNLKRLDETSSQFDFDLESLDAVSLDDLHETEAIVLVGAHENNADAIILLTINRQQETVNLVSIPRDLYYKGRKVNGIFQQYGPRVFAQELSSITGYNISKYVVIDMFAFIDVVNILGGVEVTLNEDLIDPTYKTFDNGVWSTLYFPKGTHHLNGIQALRLARSRHYSSDFARARRQHMILAAIQDRLLQFGVADIGRVAELIAAMFRHVETNINLPQMLALYRDIGHYDIRNQEVVSSHNILRSTWSNLLNLEDPSIADQPGFHRGLWILVPRNDDWSLIPRFLRALEG